MLILLMVFVKNREGRMGQLIADIQKNSKEIVRIDVSEFKEKEYINIRVWYYDFDGTAKPTQKGIALEIGKYEELKKAIDKVGDFLSDRENNSIPNE